MCVSVEVLCIVFVRVYARVCFGRVLVCVFAWEIWAPDCNHPLSLERFYATAVTHCQGRRSIFRIGGGGAARVRTFSRSAKFKIVYV